MAEMGRDKDKGNNNSNSSGFACLLRADDESTERAEKDGNCSFH